MKEYPIAEIFTEVQGEGQFAGTMMTFVRLAGCTVGKRYPKSMYEESIEGVVTDAETGAVLRQVKNPLPIYTEMCTLYDGRTFLCDTDYRMKEKLTVDQILARVERGVERICITGGEPLMHDLAPLLQAALDKNFQVHIETSGTIKPPYFNMLVVQDSIWLTVAPKMGVLDVMVSIADEIKLLVDKEFDWEKVPQSVKNHELVYLHPVNGEHTVNVENLQRVRVIQQGNPQYRIGLQLHKVLEHYLGERVR